MLGLSLFCSSKIAKIRFEALEFRGLVVVHGELFIIPAVFISFSMIFHKPMGPESLMAIYQTNPNESLEFIESFVSGKLLTIFFAVPFFMFLLLFYQEKTKRRDFKLSLVALAVLTLFVFFKQFYLKLPIPSMVVESATNYYRELKTFEEEMKKRKLEHMNFAAFKKQHDETYVVVIGESLNKFHMGIYGYFRQTTPKLFQQIEKHHLLKFRRAVSNFPDTMGSLSFALTEANQYNNKKFYNALSIIDIFKKAGFQTVWITNQYFYGRWSNAVSVLANRCDEIYKLNYDDKYWQNYDESVVAPLQEVLSKQKNENKIIFIHLIGSHYHYSKRYPKRYKIFGEGYDEPYLFGNTKTLTKFYTNDYDNSVYYNDYVVDRILKALQKEHGVSALLYFSDHGEDIDGGNEHASDPRLFQFDMVEIPLLVWLSPDYVKRYPNTATLLRSHRNRYFTNDLLYDTMIGLAHIDTDRYEKRFDLTSNRYSLEEENVLTLHGKRRYTSPENAIYWQYYNARLLAKHFDISNFIISDVDTVGKCNAAWRLGFRSFKIDLFFIPKKEDFQVGTDEFDTQGNFRDFLSYFHTDKIQYLIVDLKNVTEKNREKIVKRLKEIPELSKVTNLFFIVQNPKFAKDFQREGWRVFTQKNTKTATFQNAFHGCKSTKKMIDSKLNLADPTFYEKLSKKGIMRHNGDLAIIRMTSKCNLKSTDRNRK